MFGLQDDTQKSNDDPAMLDNVKDLASQPASQVEPPQLPTADGDATQSTTAPAPAVSSFTMPSESPASDTTTVTPSIPSPATTTDDATTEDSSTPETTEEPIGHPEIPEGFSSSPTVEVVPPENVSSATDETASTDSSTPETTEEPTTSESPEIKSTSAPAISTPMEPAQNDVSAPPQPAETSVAESTEQQEPSGESDSPNPLNEVDHEQLASLKQEALGHLEGLSEHIDGAPEEVFRTTMQLIQANDNHTLIEKALDAAKKIEDDKVRAQAMLDIINEINYFSQT